MEDDVGFRFHPKDYELVDHYLRHKMLGNESKVRKIGELNITDFEPWELPAKSVVQTDDDEWYFFCPRKPKYSTGRRSQRNTKRGQWKITGKERKIKRRDTNLVIGTKRTLVFQEGRSGSRPRRTNWVMHEYSSIVNSTNDPHLKPYVLCLLKKKWDENDTPTHFEPEPSHTPVASPTFDNHVDEFSIPELYDHQQPDMDSLFDPQHEVDFSDLQLLIQEKQGSPRMESNDYDVLQFLSGASDQEDNMKFLNVITAGDPREAESMIREYGDYNLVSSDTDAEVVNPRYQQSLEGLSNALASSKEHQMMGRHIELQCGSVSHAYEGHRKGKNVSRYQFKSPNVSSSAADHYHSVVEEKQAAVPRVPKKVSRLTKLSLQPHGESRTQRKQSLDEGNKSGAESSNGIKGLKKGVLSSIGCFIVMDAPLSRHKPSSPSVYFVNALVGAVLWIVVFWELASLRSVG